MVKNRPWWPRAPALLMPQRPYCCARCFCTRPLGGRGPARTREAWRPTPRGPPDTRAIGKQTLFLQRTFRGLCAATSLSAWRERNSLPNESRETFPKCTGPGRVPRPTCGSRSRAGARGPRGGCWALVSVQPPRVGTPKATGETGLQNMGALAAPPQQPPSSVPERGDPFLGK